MDPVLLCFHQFIEVNVGLLSQFCLSDMLHLFATLFRGNHLTPHFTKSFLEIRLSMLLVAQSLTLIKLSKLVDFINQFFVLLFNLQTALLKLFLLTGNHGIYFLLQLLNLIRLPHTKSVEFQQFFL